MGFRNWWSGEHMTWTPSFETNRDTLRPVAADIEAIELVLPGTGSSLRRGTVTVTTADPHGFVVPEADSYNWQVTIAGAGEPFDGTWKIDSVTETTFTFTVFWSQNISRTYEPGDDATATSPAPAFLRYRPEDVLLEDLGAAVSFTAESWDYNTIRLIWTSTDSLNKRVLDDAAAGKTPRLLVVRSGFGHPTTVNDGSIIFNRPFLDVVDSVNIVDEGARQPVGSSAPITFEPIPSNGKNDWDRPSNNVRGLFDRNLPSGKWFYYGLFLYVSTYDSSGNYLAGPFWVKAGEASAVTPHNYRHGERLFNLLPPYYQFKDGEYTAGTNREGAVKRLLATVGFELDLTRTLTEGVEQTYDLNFVQNDLVRSLGTTNFGLNFEEGLGDIRYRSMLTAISDLYDERGSASGLRKLTFVSSKYRCKIIDGLNMMNLPDDTEFSSGTGSWGDLYGSYEAWVKATGPYWLRTSWLIEGDTEATEAAVEDDLTTVADMEHVEMPVSASIDISSSVVPRRSALKVTGLDTSKGVVLTCGLGTGETYDRYQNAINKQFYPRLHGVKCVPGHIYTFSTYIKRDEDVDPDYIRLGVLWFNEPANGVFDITTDFISPIEDNENIAEAGVSYFTRYSQDAQAPLSLRGQPHVFAVPYIVLWNSETRYVSACMLNNQLNSSDTFALVPDVYLTLGDETERLGDPDIFIGGV